MEAGNHDYTIESSDPKLFLDYSLSSAIPFTRLGVESSIKYRAISGVVSDSMESIGYGPVSQAHLDEAIRIETSAYPEDEAASLEALKTRQSLAPHLFFGSFLKIPNQTDKLIGYICATSSDNETFTHESMSTHSPTGKSICIHSVCIDPQHQRRSLGSTLLKKYLDVIHQLAVRAQWERVLLIAHQELIPFYTKAGFELIGESEVAHGSKPWYQMRLLLSPPPPDQDRVLRLVQAFMEPQSQPPGQGISKPGKRNLLSFSGGATQAANEDKTNKFDILCPRPGCTSVILKTSATTLTERPSTVLDNPTRLPPPDLLPHIPPPGFPMWTWKIGPPADPMVFENIGFSRNLPVASFPSGDNSVVKLLICAECDLGPLGWCEQGKEGMSYWLVCNRVAYK